MNDSRAVVAEAGFQTLQELERVLAKSGVEAEIVAPPGCDPNG